MAATVIDDYSDEMALNRAPLYAPMAPNVHLGRVRMSWFTMTFATEASGADVAVAIIPKGARILSGWIVASATTGTATLSVGLAATDGSGFLDTAGVVSDNIAVLRAAAAITTTAKTELAATSLLGFGYIAQKELYMTVTTGAAAMAGQVVSGFISYVID